MFRVRIDPPSGTIVLDRPERRNALSRQLIADLIETLGDLHLQRQVRAVILTGAGDAFCAGIDLAEIHATQQSAEPHLHWQRDAVLYRDLLRAVLDFPKPVIAAVNGPALGAGAGLLLACDVVLAGPSASIGFPEPLRGLVAGVPAPLLAFRAGGAVAARMLLTSATLDAAEAHRLELVQEIVPEAQLWARAQQLAQQIALGAPESIQLTKQLLNDTIGESLRTLLTAGAAATATARTTEAAAEGVAAFLERRPPDWP